ncbi:hypothetical protein AAVH_42954 [Aphelenchoides avenae]|nr:hypothetical protein AAVH_42954 [Aphelenchus avenae]
MGYPTIFALCLLGFLELGNAGDCEIRCFRDLKVNVTLFESRGRDAVGESQELDCNKENTDVHCERCCQLWALKNGKSNVIPRNEGIILNKCYCCTKECS